jgi:hypothetical protein
MDRWTATDIRAELQGCCCNDCMGGGATWLEIAEEAIIAIGERDAAVAVVRWYAAARNYPQYAESTDRPQHVIVDRAAVIEDYGKQARAFLATLDAAGGG